MSAGTRVLGRAYGASGRRMPEWGRVMRRFVPCRGMPASAAVDSIHNIYIACCGTGIFAAESEPGNFIWLCRKLFVSL